MVARDQANQGAAVLMTSVGRARELGIPEARWIYLYCGADVRERTVIERQDLSAGPASVLAAIDAGLAGVRTVPGVMVFDPPLGPQIPPPQSATFAATGAPSDASARRILISAALWI